MVSRMEGARLTISESIEKCECYVHVCCSFFVGVLPPYGLRVPTEIVLAFIEM